eukprot:TRINITY_DN10129_c3_g1_i1.p1 TRINITY_DN10129_c3_g1~~TRINITY_DN10129_c3_g1_i1.p1  ORF type:complete len:1646 (+),score=317.13 TRINITY_DN10129_c3_g1_i1:193-5130(+)
MGCAPSSGKKAAEAAPESKNTTQTKSGNEKSTKESRRKAKKDKYRKKNGKGRFTLNLTNDTNKVGKGLNNKEGSDRRKAYLKKLQEPSPYADVLAPYIPWPVLKQFQVISSPVSSPEYCSFYGVVMMVDISGFTALGESLSKLPNMLGVELLATYINAYFTQMIDCVQEYGGAVEKFAGDALIVLFGSQYCTDSLNSLSVYALNCAMEIQSRYPSYCAKLSADAPGEVDRELRVHIGIGASEVKTMTVGGVGDIWRRVVFGEVFDQLGDVMPLSKDGDVVISKQTWACVAKAGQDSLFNSEIVSEAGREGHLITMKEGTKIPGGHPLPRITLTAAMERGVRGFVDFFLQSRLDEGQQQISESRGLSMLFMGVNNWDELNHKIAGTGDAAFISIHQMIRSIQGTVYRYEGCIANCLVDEKGCSIIITYGMPQHDDDPTRAIKSALEIKERCEQLGIGISIGVTSGETFVGSIGSLVRRDYTIMGTAVNLGARLMSLCDSIYKQQLNDNQKESETPDGQNPNPSEGVEPSPAPVPAQHITATTPTDEGDSTIQKVLSRTSLSPNKEQAVWSQILVDEATFTATKKTALYITNLPKIQVRGYDAPVSIHAPVKLFKGKRDFAAHQRAIGDGGQDSEGEDEERQLVMIGRAAEVKVLEDVRGEVTASLGDAEYKNTIRTRVVIVYGEGGMGKSYLTRHCAGQIENGTIPGVVLESSAEGTSSMTAYSLWEPIFTQLLLAQLPPHISTARHVTQHLQEISKTDDWMEFGYLNLEFECFLPLLNPILKTSFREPPSLADLGPGLRAKTTTSLLHVILKYNASKQPLLILFDSMHNNIDIPSLELLQQLAASKDRTAPIMIVCSQRPAGNDVKSKQSVRIWKRIQEYTQSVTNITLKPLSQEQSAELLVHLLNRQLLSHPEVAEIKEADPTIASFVYKNSRYGKIFLLVAIANAFRDELLKTDNTKSSLVITASRIHFAGNDETGFHLQLPKSVTHFARSTIDRLHATQQLIIKCAAVIGKKFTLEAIQVIFPVAKSKANIMTAVVKLEEQRILSKAGSGREESSYRFVDSVVQEEAYTMVLHEQRLQWHKQLAEWIEGKLIVADSDSDEHDEQNDSVSQLARHWCAYAKYAEEHCTLEELDRAIWWLRKSASWHARTSDPYAAYGLLQSALAFIPLRMRKCDDTEKTNDMELTILSDITHPVYKSRYRFTPEDIIKLHDQLLAIDIETQTDAVWEARYRATAGRAVELALLHRFEDALNRFDNLEEMTAEAGGEIEEVLRACTAVQVYSYCGTKNEDLIETVKDTMVLIQDNVLDCSKFSAANLTSFFEGLSSGLPVPDLLISLRLTYLVMGSFGQAESTEDVGDTYTSDGKSKGVNQARLYCLACQYHALLKNNAQVMKFAEAGLDLANKLGDTLSITLGNFFTALARRSPDEAVDYLRSLQNCFGPCILFRCLLLESALDNAPDPSPFADFLKESKPGDGQFGPEYCRIQAVFYIKLLDTNPTLASQLVPEQEGASIKARVLSEVEVKLVQSFTVARQRKAKLFQLKILSSLYAVWGGLGILKETPASSAVLVEIGKQVVKSEGRAKKFLDPFTAKAIEETIQPGTRSSSLTHTSLTVSARTVPQCHELLESVADSVLPIVDTTAGEVK